jgi:hypothetical protein
MTKITCFLSYMEDSSKRKTYIQKQTWSYTRQQAEYGNIGTTPWNSGKEGKEKRLIVNSTEILHICADRGHNDMYWKLPNNGEWEGRVKGEGVEPAKVKHIHSWDTLGNPFGHWLWN